MSRITYTPEQRATILEIADPRFELLIAKAQYKSMALLPDGTLSTDLSAFVPAAQARVAALIAVGTSEALSAAAFAQARVTEIEDSIAQDRFLFVVGDDSLPIIYFQCATPTNPDLPKEK